MELSISSQAQTKSHIDKRTKRLLEHVGQHVAVIKISNELIRQTNEKKSLNSGCLLEKKNLH